MKRTILAFAVLLSVQMAEAATRTVVALADSGAGTLREAIAASINGDAINFAVTGPIILTSGELAIGRSITITGPGANLLVISGNGASRAFNIVASNAVVSISGLTVTGGASGTQGGGIFNSGTLTLSYTTISDNHVAGADGVYPFPNGSDVQGGGICNLGALTLVDCTLAGNSASGGNGKGTDVFENYGDGGAGAGGGIFNSGVLMLLGCTFSSNSVAGGFGEYSILQGHPGAGNLGLGGAIYNQGVLAMTNCTVAFNTASGGRGGDNDSSFARNGGDGGGASGAGIWNNSTLSICACTIASNGAIGGAGGVGDSSGAGGAATGGGVFDSNYGFYQNTIIANNILTGGARGAGTSMGPNGSTSGPDVAGPTTSLGHNLIGKDDGSSGWVGSDLTGTIATPLNPLLAGFQDNGGSTFTMALLSASSAIDAGDDSVTNSLATDQRGLPRLSGAHVDIGAVEFQPRRMIWTLPASSITPADATLNGSLSAGDAATYYFQYGLTANYGSLTSVGHLAAGVTALAVSDEVSGLLAGTVYHFSLVANNAAGSSAGVDLTFQSAGVTNFVSNTNDAGTGSLRAAIASSPPGGFIYFGANVSGKTIMLTSGELLIDKTLTIIGPTSARLSISGNGGRVFHITSGTVNLSNLTIRDGLAQGAFSQSIVPGGDGNGGGVFNEATLTLTACTLTGNSARGGLGGLSTFSSVRGGSGGNGNGGAIFNQGTLSLVNSTLSGNSAAGGPGGFSVFAQGGNGGNGEGGAVFNQGVLTLVHCTLSSNSVTGASGGGGNSSGNNGSGNGGGIFILFNQSILSYNPTYLHTTLVAGNNASSGPDISGFVVSLGYNLIGRTDGGNSGWGGSDLVGGTTSDTRLDPLLGPLQDNGGPTFTHALLPGSPAIDKGNAFGLMTDQRGRLRAFDYASIPNASGGDGSDIGAFELQPNQPVLNIAVSANNVVLSWSTNDTGYTLQANTNLASLVTWSNVPGVLNVVGGQFKVTNGPAVGTKIYRLKQ